MLGPYRRFHGIDRLLHIGDFQVRGAAQFGAFLDQVTGAGQFGRVTSEQAVEFALEGDASIFGAGFSWVCKPISAAKSSLPDSLLSVTPSSGRLSRRSASTRMLASSRSTSAANSLRPLLTSLSRVRDNRPRCCEATNNGGK